MAFRPWGLCVGALPDLYRLAAPGKSERIKLKVLGISHFVIARHLKRPPANHLDSNAEVLKVPESINP